VIKYIESNNQLLAIIIPHNFKKPGITFFTQDNFSQQLAYMNHPSGKIIEPHVHNAIRREFNLTKEVLLLRKGKLRVDIYDSEYNYVESIILVEGDVILLASGGHGFEALEEVEMFEIKQGPYAGEAGKTKFIGIKNKDIVIKGDCVDDKNDSCK